MPFKKEQVNNNAKDPLHRVTDNGGQELFQQLSKVCNGFTHGQVTAACGNLLLNAIRQQCDTASKASRAYDELFTKLKTILMEQHYYSSGPRRNVFPFHQVVYPDLFKDDDDFKKM